MKDYTTQNIIDLTLPYDEKISGYDFSIARTVEKDGWNARNLKIYSHAGTHMDAPFHFGIGDKTIDTFQPHQLMGEAWVVRLGEVMPSQLLEVHHLGILEEKVKPGDSLLIHTGWSRFVGQAQYRDQLPRIGESLARWCVDRKIRILGVEPPSVADVNNLEEVTRIHEILLEGGVIIVEGLTNLDKIKSDQVWLIALPLKIRQGDGAPARVIAMEKKS